MNNKIMASLIIMLIFLSSCQTIDNKKENTEIVEINTPKEETVEQDKNTPVIDSNSEEEENSNSSDDKQEDKETSNNMEDKKADNENTPENNQETIPSEGAHNDHEKPNFIDISSVKQGEKDWLYIVDRESEDPLLGHLYRVKADGSEYLKISDDVAWELIVDGDWIYYRSLMNATYDPYNFEYHGQPVIYKIKKDGTSKSIIYKGKSRLLAVKDGWVYFEEDFSSLSRIKVDGSEKQRLIDKHCLYPNFVGDYIYYKGFDMGSKIYRMNLDGTNKIEVFNLQGLVNNAISNMIVDNNQIYLLDSSYNFTFYEGEGIYSLTIDGTNFRKLKDDNVTWAIAVKDNKIYYNTEEELDIPNPDDPLHNLSILVLNSYDTITKKHERLFEVNSDYLSSKGDWLIYVKENQFYRLNIVTGVEESIDNMFK